MGGRGGANRSANRDVGGGSGACAGVAAARAEARLDKGRLGGGAATARVGAGAGVLLMSGLPEAAFDGMGFGSAG